MFDNSMMRDDVSDWMAYKLEYNDYNFKNYKFFIPYWGSEQDLVKRKIAIDNYHEVKKLRKI